MLVLPALDSSWREEERFRIDGHSPSGARPPPPEEDSLRGALCVSETASRTGVEELEEDEVGLDGADEGEVGAEILDGGAAALAPPGAGRAGLPERRSVDCDRFACGPAAAAGAAAAFGEGWRLGVDGRAAFGDGWRLGVAGLRLAGASSSASWSDFRSSSGRTPQASIRASATTARAQTHPH